MVSCVRGRGTPVHCLEYASLLVRYHDTDTCFVGLTRLGVHALQTNTVRRHLGLSDTRQRVSPSIRQTDPFWRGLGGIARSAAAGR